MMENMGPPDSEFAEFETTESQMDAMMAAGEPVEVSVPGKALYVRVRASDLSWGGSTVVPQLTNIAPALNISGPAKLPSEAIA
jgi:hypothetical protein